MTETAKLVNENGDIWANLSGFSEENDWLFAHWQPIAVPTEVMDLLMHHEEAANNQLFVLADEYEAALHQIKMFVAQEDGSCFPIKEIQKGTDGIAIKR